jgi:hypothetical protein
MFRAVVVVVLLLLLLSLLENPPPLGMLWIDAAQVFRNRRWVAVVANAFAAVVFGTDGIPNAQLPPIDEAARMAKKTEILLM